MNFLNYICPTSSKDFYNSITEIFYPIEFVKKNKNLSYANCPAVFDIEASSFYNENGEKQACMYAFNYGINGRCVRGRTWEEFLYMLQQTILEYDISLKKRLIIYVQNLSYEFQWFRKWFEWEKVFAVGSREVLYAVTTDGIEFRCSYLLSGYSLEKIGDNLNKYKVEKKVGDLDYRKIRHSKTELTEKEWGYILNDGLVVMAYIAEQIERLGSIINLPLTNTGFVRNLFREKCLKGDDRFFYNKIIRSLTLNDKVYKQLKRGFTGGFTHANSHYVDKILYDISSFDFTSSYPAVMVAEKFPMSKPFIMKATSGTEFIKILNNFCCIFECKFYNIRSKVPYENYISKSRCYSIENYIANNGRIVEADYLALTVTEQDFAIISKLYKWNKIEISEITCFYKDYLPRDFILTLLKLYKSKTELKGVEGKEVEYMVSKNMINSAYGMCVTDICKDEQIYSNGEWSCCKANIEETINKYNKNPQRFLFYPWGVWVTAYARRNLFSGITEFGMDYVYSDTDSIKVKNIDKHKQYIEKYNIDITKKINECLKYHNIDKNMAKPKTKKGIEKPLGVWDYEGTYTRFKTLGAKRYIFEKNDEIEITIAGVSKKSGSNYLKNVYKNNDEIFDNFKDGLHFPSEYLCGDIVENGSGKLCHTYIDCELKGEVIDYKGEKNTYYERSCVHMENTDYTMGIAEEFLALLNGLKGGEYIE